MNGKGSSSGHRPDCFGSFPVRGDLGPSRFGPVYLGRDTSTNTRVVIRTFDLSREQREFGAQSDLLDSFRKLCETTLDHAGLARPLAFGAEGQIPYLVYSDLAGTAMDAVMRQHGPRPVAEVLQRAKQLADAIDCAASAGVHHGMMAPCDVTVDGDETGVTGFGLAQALIKAGIPAGGVAPYGSPQRLAGAPPTRADDVYSLAAITLELLIGTPRDPDQDTSRALREAQGLPERRRVPRPAPHETRMFTTIAGVDAGKLRAAFAAAFSEEPGERPSTAAEFVTSFQDACSTRRVTDEPAPSVMADPVVSDEDDESAEAPVHEEPPAAPVHEEPRSALVLVTSRAEGAATRETPVRQEPVVGEGRAARRRRARARRREKLATSQPPIQEAQEQDLREFESESPVKESYSGSDVIRLPPIVDDAVLEEVTPPLPRAEAAPPRARVEVAPPRVRSMVHVPNVTPVQSGSGPRAFLVAAVVAVSFGSGFGGGFVVGHFSKPSTESTDVSHQATVAEPQTAPPPAEEPKPLASASSQPVAPAAVQPAVPVVDTGRLLVRSTPAGAGVTIDGQSRGVTPLDLRELPFGAHTIEVSHPGHDTRRRRLTLSKRHPERSVTFELRPGNVPAQTPLATNSPGSLQVASRPSGAQVFVDDSLIGTTPLLMSNVSAGLRRLRIEMSGYKIWTTSVQIEPSARFRISASLEP